MTAIHDFERRVFDLPIPDNCWEECGMEDDNMAARLLTTVCVSGVHHHLSAYEVKVNDDGIQVVTDSSFEENYEGMCMESQPEGRYQTLKIRGRDYVLCMTPFC